MNKATQFNADRRAFLGGVSLSLGGVAVATLLPVSLLQAAPASLSCSAQDACGDWQLDDICISYPPYAFRIDTGVPRHGRVMAAVEAVDQYWVS